MVEPLLPLAQPSRASRADGRRRAREREREFIFEPNKEALLERLVPMYVEISILRALYESMACELGARMTAMDSATKNAKEMIDALTLAVQQRAPGRDHQGADGDHRRRRSAEGVGAS